MRKAIQGKVKGLVQNQFKKPTITMAEETKKEEEAKTPDPVVDGAEEAEAEAEDNKEIVEAGK